MLVKDLIKFCDLKLVVGKNGLDKKITSGYVCDLLSIVMGNTKANSVWITVQSHVNIVAVAVLSNISCIIITEGFKPDEETITKAQNENIPIFTTNLNSFNIVKQLNKLGL